MIPKRLLHIPCPELGWGHALQCRGLLCTTIREPHITARGRRTNVFVCLHEQIRTPDQARQKLCLSQLGHSGGRTIKVLKVINRSLIRISNFYIFYACLAQYLDQMGQIGSNLDQKSVYNFQKPLLCLNMKSVTSKLKIWPYLAWSDQILGLIGAYTAKNANFG